ncbi:TPA: DUF4230 domain-containing protein [Streptococcus suis]
MKAIKTFFRIKIYLWVMVCLLVALFGMWAVGYSRGAGNQSSERTVSSTIQSIEKVNELVFLTTGIETVITEKNRTEIFGKEVPFTEKSALIILRYKVKFGITDPISIEQKGDNRYQVRIPKFRVVGFALSENPYTLYDKSGEILSLLTEEVDTGSVLTEQFKSKEQEKVLQTYNEDIQSSAMSYYINLFRAISPDIKLEFVFAD